MRDWDADKRDRVKVEGEELKKKHQVKMEVDKQRGRELVITVLSTFKGARDCSFSSILSISFVQSESC